MAMLAVLAVGCSAPRCGGGAPATGGVDGGVALSTGAVADGGVDGGVALSSAMPELPEAERRAMPGLIAFVSERAPHKDVWLVSPAGEERQLTRGLENDYPVAPSPDGRAMLVVSTREDDQVQREQLRVVPLDGGELVPLHRPRARARNASWGPDGTWLVAESDAQGFSDLVRLEVRKASPEKRLTQVREGCFEPAVSPDGKRLAYVSSGEGDPEIFVMKMDGTDVRRLTNFYMEDVSPRWSPDGRWLAFSSNRERGRERLFIVRPDGTALRAVSGNAPTGDEREAVWSPDSTKLAFVGRPQDPREGKARIWVASVTGGDAVPLTDGKQVDDQPAWSPDGKHLVFVSERGGDVDLHLMRADGSGQTRLTTSKGADWLPRWFVQR